MVLQEYYDRPLLAEGCREVDARAFGVAGKT